MWLSLGRHLVDPATGRMVSQGPEQDGILPSMPDFARMVKLVLCSPKSRSLSDPGHRDLTEGRDEGGDLGF